MSDRTVFGGNSPCDKNDGQIQETEEIESKFASFIFFLCLFACFVCLFFSQGQITQKNRCANNVSALRNNENVEKEAVVNKMRCGGSLYYGIVCVHVPSYCYETFLGLVFVKNEYLPLGYTQKPVLEPLNPCDDYNFFFFFFGNEMHFKNFFQFGLSDRLFYF